MGHHRRYSRAGGVGVEDPLVPAASWLALAPLWL